MSFGGGSWTDKKLKALQRYLNAYMTLMKDKPNAGRPFEKIYFDAFCGSGTRVSDAPSLFDSRELGEFAEFSPRVALSVHPPFDRYIFCDVRQDHTEKLRSRLLDLGFSLATSEFRVGDANTLIKHFCSSIDWRRSRAVMFLDPYGLQVEWQTLQTIAATEAIDLWYLFPSGLGPLRMTPRSGRVPEEWAARLTKIWGNDGWRDVAYTAEVSDDLFGRSDSRLLKSGDAGAFERAFMQRLREIFPGVSQSALRLRNSNGFEMFSLIFACANPSSAARGPALKIANHIVQMRD